MSAASPVQLTPTRDTPGAALGMLERRVTLGTIVALVGLAAVAWALTIQQALGMADMVTGLAQVGSRMPNPMTAPVFMLMWLTMMVAMMFPTIAPMVLAHRLVVVHRGEGALPTVVFIAGYLVVWTASGLVPLAVFLAFRDLPDDQPLAAWLPRLSGLVLVGAGLYQFTPWKRACLRACRTPLGFIMTHDFGSGTPGAFKAGLSHGAYCLGCCWALMSVLVVVGLMNLVWMAALALVFLAEKNWPRGATLNRLVGTAIAVLGCAVLLYPDVLGVVSGVTTPSTSMMSGM
jgi:predicted metal-binding membrane protein